MINKHIILITCSIINLVIASIIAEKFIYQYVTLIIISAIIFTSEALRAGKIRNDTFNKLATVYNVIAKICFIIGFFIILGNVCFMKKNERPCGSCIVLNEYWIAASSFYTSFYFLFMYVSLIDSFKDVVKMN